MVLRISDDASVGTLLADQLLTNNALKVAENQSVDNVLGHAAVGGVTDANNTDTWARLAHFDQREFTNCAIAQNQNGLVLVNAPADQSVTISIAEDPRLRVLDTEVALYRTLNVFPPGTGIVLPNITLDRDTGNVTCTGGVTCAQVTATTSATLPADTTIGPNVTGTEIEMLNGVTSAIQTQLDALQLHPNHAISSTEVHLDALDQTWTDVFTVTLTNQTSTHMPVSFKLRWVQSANVVPGRCNTGEAINFGDPAQTTQPAAFTKYNTDGGNLTVTHFQLIRNSDTSYTVQYQFNHSSHGGVTTMVHLDVLASDATVTIT